MLETKKQPEPIKTSKSKNVHDFVGGYMEARRRLAREKYGDDLWSHNERDSFYDLFDELIDAVMYAGQIVMEREENENAEKKHSNVIDTLLHRGTEYVILDEGVDGDNDRIVLVVNTTTNAKAGYCRVLNWCHMWGHHSFDDHLNLAIEAFLDEILPEQEG